MTLLDKFFQEDDKCFIIAEAGVNHNGDIFLAKKLIDAAIDAGADAVKFQTFKAENLVTQDAPKALYQQQTTGAGTQYEMLRSLELSWGEHCQLKGYCDDRGILFLSTPFDFESVDLLARLNVPVYKTSSGDLTNLPLLKYVAEKNKPIILSTGMATLGEVEDAVHAIEGTGNNNLTLLHCTSNYPTQYQDVNLRAILTLKEAFKKPVGYSDHTLGNEVAIAAVALGAKVIEKHLTLDKNMPGPDHKASLSPQEFKELVSAIRNIEKSMGDGIKRCQPNEEKSKYVSRKSIVAKRPINKGESISIDMLDFKRPEDGISPRFINNVIGKKVLVNINKDETLSWSKLGCLV